jgi:hypothetical protein
MDLQITRRRFLRQTIGFSAAVLASQAMPAFAAHPHGEADLLMIGDWGNAHPAAQELVAAGMVKYTHAQRLRPQALLMLGDNWYDELLGGVDSPRWKTHFEDLYPARVFPGPAYAILGNHDYQMYPTSKVEAELAYARRGHSRWTMPAKWYSFDFPAKKPLIHFIALDSNMPHEIKPNADGTPNRNFTLTEEERVAQLAWLEKELATPRLTPFTIVMAHHPVYTDGPHGDHPMLIRDWDPLLQRYGVHAYLGGHDHDLQHLEFAGHPTSFFLSGGGGADLYDLKITPDKRGPWAQKVNGFSHLSVTDKLLTLRHVDAAGNTLHAFTKTPDGKTSVLSA